jgi:hypothetical protein
MIDSYARTALVYRLFAHAAPPSTRSTTNFLSAVDFNGARGGGRCPEEGIGWRLHDDGSPES